MLIVGVLDPEFQDLVLSLTDTTLFEGLGSGGIFGLIGNMRNQNQTISVISLRGLVSEQDIEWFDRLALGAPDPACEAL